MPKLAHLKVENYKAIELVEVDLAGNVITVTGQNDSGKSSLIDSIAYLFGGKAFKPERPIRNGAEFAQILGRLDNGITLKRRVTETKDTLTIESSDGARFPSPQTVADKMFNPISFDPDSFSRLTSKEQAALLRKLTGLNTAVLDAKRKDITAMITAATAAKKTCEAQREQVAKLPPPPPEEIPDHADIAEIASEIARHGALKRANDAKRRDAAEARASVGRLEADIAKIESTLAGLKDRLAKNSEIADRLTEEERKLEDPPTTDLDARLTEAKEHNKKVEWMLAQKREYERIIDLQRQADLRIGEQVQKITDLKEQQQKIDDEKAEMLAKANMPVPGMTVEEDDVLIDGVPYSQISASEQIKIGFIMSQAAKIKDSDKEVRICLIKDGDRLDDNKRKLIHEMAIAKDVMILEERVARDGIVGIHLEHGRVKGAPMPEPAPVPEDADD